VGQKGIVRDFFLWKMKRQSSIGKRIFFVHNRIVSADKRVEFVCDRTSYIVLSGRWCVIVLNAHATPEEK
jgi:hypothetical protein